MLVTELIRIFHNVWHWKQRWITVETTTHGQLIAQQSLCLMVNDNGCTRLLCCCCCWCCCCCYCCCGHCTKHPWAILAIMMQSAAAVEDRTTTATRMAPEQPRGTWKVATRSRVAEVQVTPHQDLNEKGKKPAATGITISKRKEGISIKLYEASWTL